MGGKLHEASHLDSEFWECFTKREDGAQSKRLIRQMGPGSRGEPRSKPKSLELKSRRVEAESDLRDAPVFTTGMQIAE